MMTFTHYFICYFYAPPSGSCRKKSNAQRRQEGVSFLSTVCSLLLMSRDLLAPVLNVGMVEEGLQHVEVTHKDLIHACLPKKMYEIGYKAFIDVLLTVICTWIKRHVTAALSSSSYFLVYMFWQPFYFTKSATPGAEQKNSTQLPIHWHATVLQKANYCFVFYIHIYSFPRTLRYKTPSLKLK
jgi:hypothetical protein